LTGIRVAGTISPMDAPPAMVRFFAAFEDDSDLAYAFVEGIVTLGVPVRLIPARPGKAGAIHLWSHPQGVGGPVSRWARFSDLFMTPMSAPMTNVVCGDHEAWGRLYTLGGGVTRNLLITGDHPNKGSDQSVRQARLYDVLVVPTDDLAQAWRDAGATPVVVPPEVLAVVAILKAALTT
jgi:hypothetical protein